MAEETLLDEIVRLRGVLNRAAHGISTPDDAPTLSPGNADKPDEIKLMLITVATMHNLLDTLKNRHNQIDMAMSFALYVTFYARKINPSNVFWATEINDDIEAQSFLFQTAQGDLEYLLGKTRDHQKVHEAAQRQKNLLDEFDRRNIRRVQGKTLYEKAESPGEQNEEQARILLLNTRDTQLHASIKEINLLISRAIFCAKRLHVLEISDLPDLQNLDIYNEDQRAAEISTTLTYGLNILEDAETTLRFHAARHSAFSDRLDTAPKPE